MQETPEETRTTSLFKGGVTWGNSTTRRTYLMYADTEKEKDDWIGAIGRAIVRCSSTYTNEDGMEDEDDDDDDEDN